MTTNLEKWLHTLETTDLEQGTDYLHYIDHEDEEVEKFCCLGVGCVVADIKNEGMEANTYVYDGTTVVAPTRLIQWLGIPFAEQRGGSAGGDEWDIRVFTSDDQPLLDLEGKTVSATRMNDGGFTFAQIAQVLRTHTLKAM